jgi:tryptophan synthase alpha chain
LVMPLLVAPSTPPQRAERIAAASTGFVYVVSRLGVTGASRAPQMESLRRQLDMLRQLTTKPLAVGFGLRSPQDVRDLAAIADGVVVGSALIDAYSGYTGADAARRVSEFVAPLIAATA